MDETQLTKRFPLMNRLSQRQPGTSNGPVVSIRRVAEDHFYIREQCDAYSGKSFTHAELIALSSELFDFANNAAIGDKP